MEITECVICLLVFFSSVRKKNLECCSTLLIRNFPSFNSFKRPLNVDFQEVTSTLISVKCCLIKSIKTDKIYAMKNDNGTACNLKINT